MPQWEYQTAFRSREFNATGVAKDWNVDITKPLADLGGQGWELVAVVPRCDHAVHLRDPLFGATTGELWVFKRQKAA